MSKLRIVLGLQLLFFAVWGDWLLSSRNSASPEFYLETVPVDPRDLLSGTYVALTYDISAPKADGCAALADSRGDFFVRLEDRGRTERTPAGTVPVYEATACAAGPGQEYGWVKAEPQHNSWRPGTALYGIERFYLNENNPLKDARSGSVVAKVKIGRNRRLDLLDLVKKI